MTDDLSDSEAKAKVPLSFWMTLEPEVAGALEPGPDDMWSPKFQENMTDEPLPLAIELVAHLHAEMQKDCGEGDDELLAYLTDTLDTNYPIYSMARTKQTPRTGTRGRQEPKKSPGHSEKFTSVAGVGLRKIGYAIQDVIQTLTTKSEDLVIPEIRYKTAQQLEVDFVHEYQKVRVDELIEKEYEKMQGNMLLSPLRRQRPIEKRRVNLIREYVRSCFNETFRVEGAIVKVDFTYSLLTLWINKALGFHYKDGDARIEKIVDEIAAETGHRVHEGRSKTRHLISDIPPAPKEDEEVEPPAEGVLDPPEPIRTLITRELVEDTANDILTEDPEIGLEQLCNQVREDLGIEDWKNLSFDAIRLITNKCEKESTAIAKFRVLEIIEGLLREDSQMEDEEIIEQVFPKLDIEKNEQAENTIKTWLQGYRKTYKGKGKGKSSGGARRIYIGQTSKVVAVDIQGVDSGQIKRFIREKISQDPEMKNEQIRWGLEYLYKPEVIDPYFYDIERWIEEEREDPSQKYRIVVGMRSELDLYRDVGEIMNELGQDTSVETVEKRLNETSVLRINLEPAEVESLKRMVKAHRRILRQKDRSGDTRRKAVFSDEELLQAMERLWRSDNTLTDEEVRSKVWNQNIKIKFDDETTDDDRKNAMQQLKALLPVGRGKFVTRINWKHLRAGIKAMLDVPGRTDQAFSVVKSRISKDYKIIFDEQETKRLEKEILSVKKEILQQRKPPALPPLPSLEMMTDTEKSMVQYISEYLQEDGTATIEDLTAALYEEFEEEDVDKANVTELREKVLGGARRADPPEMRDPQPQASGSGTIVDIWTELGKTQEEIVRMIDEIEQEKNRVATIIPLVSRLKEELRRDVTQFFGPLMELVEQRQREKNVKQRSKKPEDWEEEGLPKNLEKLWREIPQFEIILFLMEDFVRNRGLEDNLIKHLKLNTGKNLKPHERLLKRLMVHLKDKMKGKKRAAPQNNTDQKRQRKDPVADHKLKTTIEIFLKRGDNVFKSTYREVIDNVERLLRKDLSTQHEQIKNFTKYIKGKMRAYLKDRGITRSNQGAARELEEYNLFTMPRLSETPKLTWKQVKQLNQDAINRGPRDTSTRNGYYRPPTRKPALFDYVTEEIKHYQNTESFCISQKGFGLEVREIFQEHEDLKDRGFRLQALALFQLQVATEAFAVALFKDALKAMEHRKGKTLEEKDIELIRVLREMGDGVWTVSPEEM